MQIYLTLSELSSTIENYGKHFTVILLYVKVIPTTTETISNSKKSAEKTVLISKAILQLYNSKLVCCKTFSRTSQKHLFRVNLSLTFFCCRFLNHTSSHHTLYEAKQLWQQRSVRHFKAYLRYELNVGFLRRLAIYFVAAGFLLRMEPFGRLLALSSPLLRYVLKI